MSRKILISILSVGTLLLSGSSVISAQNDSIALVQSDSTVLVQDSTALAQNDSTAPRSKSAIDTKIDYKAQDSLFFDLRKSKAYLYEKAQVNYKNIELTAGKIEVDFAKQEVSAFPKLDSLGQETDMPHFNDQKQIFDAQQMTYNFQSKKARIRNVITKEGEMFVHGDVVKKLPNDEAFVKHARFTTCDLEHPHFHIVALRAKIIPDDKVVTGGAMLFLNGVPTPLALPFGLFPNSQKHTSGVIIPTYGESQMQGFYLREGGFYWSINDYLDWKITGDIYTRGDWNLRNNVQYAKRYKYNGGFSMDYGMIQEGEKETENYAKTKSLRITWNHAQDQKANQNSSFSASVNYFNMASQKYSPSINDHFNNQSTSNIAYQVRLANRFNLSTTASLDYNTSSHFISASLPTIAFSMDPIYPFKRKISKGGQRWYESFKINYSMNATNQMRAADSVFWTEEMLKEMKNGIKHNIPMSMDIKLFKGKLNWNHSANFTEYWYFNTISKGLDTNYREAIIDRQNRFASTRNYNYSTGFSTMLYGMLQLKRGFFRAFRHVMTPNVNFSISPDFYTAASGYRYYQDTAGIGRRYNIFEGNPYGMPSGGKSGSLGFSVNNSFEMKVRDRKDTVTGIRKVKLIEQLSIGTSYNLAADSLNWAPISLSVRTTLFRSINLNYNAQFSLYAKDSSGQLYNKFLWETGDRKFLRRESDNSSFSISWSPSSKKKSDDKTSPAKQISNDTEIFEQPSMFDVPWSLTVSYTISYGSTYRPGYYTSNIFGYPVQDVIYRKYDTRITQTLSLNGSIQLTKNWKIDFFSGIDFMEKKLGLTRFTIARNLHCWNMSFDWVPFGDRREWGFSIRLNSSMLGDALKYDKRKSFMDSDSNYK